MFLEDLTYLGWSLSADGVVHIPGSSPWTLGKMDMNHFQHILRNALRHALLREFPAGWQQIEDVDIATSTLLNKKWNGKHPLSHVLARTLCHAHPTSARLFSMNKQCHTLCPHCQSENADIFHILHECPTMAGLRHNCPLTVSSDWPEISKNMLLCMQQFPGVTKRVWPQYQHWASEVIMFWMQKEREVRDCQESVAVRNPADDAVIALPTDHPPVRNPALDAIVEFRWCPFASRPEWRRWKGDIQIFAGLFLFWGLWTPLQEEQPSSCSWLYAFCLFLEVMGKDASRFAPEGTTFMQAVFSFRAMSEALWARCMDNAPVTELKAKHHQMIPPVWTCPFGIPFANSQIVFPHLLHLHLQYRFDMDKGEHLRVNMDEIPLKDESKLLALASSLRVRLPKTHAPPWWSFFSQVMACFQGVKASVDGKIVVKPSAGLEQFEVEVLRSVPVDIIHAALASKRPLSSVAYTRRMWKCLRDKARNHKSGHLIGPACWGATWACLFCSRERDMCQSKKSHAACPGPADGQLASYSSFCEVVLHNLSVLFNRLQFSGINDLDEDFVPRHSKIIENLISDVHALDSQKVRDLLVSTSRLPLAAWEGICNRWSLLVASWQNGSHCYIPFDWFCKDGFCLSCLTRCPCFSSRFPVFTRRPCEPRPLSRERNDVRAILISLQADLNRLEPF